MDVFMKLILLFTAENLVNGYIADSKAKCVEITLPMCKGIGYNFTSMPNQLNHQTQEEAGLEAHQFWPLVEIKCSSVLRFFLCSMYTPICLPDYTKPLPVCRGVCESARADCEPLMNQHGFEWPEQLNCDKFPKISDPTNLCMSPNQTDSEATTESPKSRITLPDFRPKSIAPSVSVVGSGKETCSCACSNSKFFKPLISDVGSRTFVYNASYCTYPCHAPHLGKENRNFLTFWVGLWSVLCCIVTFATILTFLIDRDRFKYPERPVIFLAACYFMVSIGFIIRLAGGHEFVACDNDRIRAGTTGPSQCTVVFLLVYFFGMASSVWWVILALTWFLSAGLKWSNEAIASYSQYFHIVAWATPSIMSVAILALSAVDGDPYSGICYVGNTNVKMLQIFVLSPLCACLIIGSLFLVSGFISLFRIHNIVKQQEGLLKINKLERLMVRIGIFSALYTIPASVVIGCYFYEQSNRLSWEASEVCNTACKLKYSKPEFSVFIVKYFAILVLGFASGVWILSRKTIESWKQFLCTVCCCRTPKPAYSPTEAIIVKSHTDLSSAYSRQYPMIQQLS